MSGHSVESDAPRLSLNEPEGWEAREGYLTKMHVQFNAHQGISVHLYREDVEAFVRQAAERYGITHVIPPERTESLKMEVADGERDTGAIKEGGEGT